MLDQGVEHTKVFPDESLHARRLVQKLQKQLMQTCIFLHAFHLNQLHQPREAAFRMHNPKHHIVAAASAVVEKEGCD